MVLAIGQFRVSKYAQSIFGGDAAGGIGIPGIGGGIPGVPDPSGNYDLVPGNVVPQTILPGGEVIQGVGGSPFLPGGVPMLPALNAPGGPVWDLAQGGFDYGVHELPKSGQKLFGSRIINVDLPKMITAGQAFVVIVTYTHDERGDQFGSYKIRLTLPALQITETTQEKRIGVGARDSVPINLTAPSPLPTAPVTGTVELIQTDGNDVTIDSEVISIPTEIVPNPPMPSPPPDAPLPLPPPPVSEPPVAPPPPPVPLPPVLQQVNVNVTRGEDGGMQAVIIEASGLEPSEPTTVFIYLSQKEHGNRGLHRGWNKEEWQRRVHDRLKNIAVVKATPAGSVAVANLASAYPATVSINGITTNGNGLTLNRTGTAMPSFTSIQNLVNSRLQERLRLRQPGTTFQEINRTARSYPEAQQMVKQIEAQVNAIIAKVTAETNQQMVIATGMPGASASAGGSGAAGAAGQDAIAVAGVPPLPTPPGHAYGHRNKPIYKRQRVSITASPDGTIRHVVRVREATPATPLFGYVVVYGHRSKKHTGRRKFQL